MDFDEWMKEEKIAHANDVAFMLEELAEMEDYMMECYALGVGDNEEDHP